MMWLGFGAACLGLEVPRGPRDGILRLVIPLTRVTFPGNRDAGARGQETMSSTDVARAAVSEAMNRLLMCAMSEKKCSKAFTAITKKRVRFV
ncbi:unnamed protein product [Gongylonema pulchrum]|uniref:Secreted protein n=1 Tax=Gongylonema pulchrum TaxID=637853 RepID=A0A183EXR2_9BILA|nr:unnamed protein product [Gongylonema pulchrum]